MTPKEKAIELFDKYNKTVNTITNTPIKKCALIAVDEILKCHIWKYNSIEPYKYWQEVKHEIEKL
jgi:hypothetical protein